MPTNTATYLSRCPTPRSACISGRCTGLGRPWTMWRREGLTSSWGSDTGTVPVKKYRYPTHWTNRFVVQFCCTTKWAPTRPLTRVRKVPVPAVKNIPVLEYGCCCPPAISRNRIKTIRICNIGSLDDILFLKHRFKKQQPVPNCFYLFFAWTHKFIFRHEQCWGSEFKFFK